MVVQQLLQNIFIIIIFLKMLIVESMLLEFNIIGGIKEILTINNKN